MSNAFCRHLNVVSQLIRGVGRTVGRRTAHALPSLVLTAGVLLAAPEAPWYEERVSWQHGKEAAPWHTTVRSPKGTTYRLSLIPLWAVEGGIVAIEIALASAAEQERNLLGERSHTASQPFVLTVEDLESGIERSRFGSSRLFELRSPEKMRLRVRILDTKLGKGVGNCGSCTNIQELTTMMSLERR